MTRSWGGKFLPTLEGKATELAFSGKQPKWIGMAPGVCTWDVCLGEASQTTQDQGCSTLMPVVPRCPLPQLQARPSWNLVRVPPLRYG